MKSTIIEYEYEDIDTYIHIFFDSNWNKNMLFLQHGIQ